MRNLSWIIDIWRIKPVERDIRRCDGFWMITTERTKRATQRKYEASGDRLSRFGVGKDARVAFYHSMELVKTIRKIFTSGLEKVPQNMWNLIDAICRAGQRE